MRWIARWWRLLRASKRERAHRRGTWTIPSPHGKIPVPSDAALREALVDHPPNAMQATFDEGE